jgi:transcriptional regulator with XRE-family HTH domain
MAQERLDSLPLGELVAGQRQRLSLSLADVARRVRHAAKAEGRQSGATRQWVSEIERKGRFPRPDGLRWLADAIELPVAKVAAAVAAQRRTLRSDVAALRRPGAALTHLDGNRLLATSTDGPLSLLHGAGLLMPAKHPIANDVSADAAAMNALRTADRQVGGGHLYATVVHYLQTQVAPRLFGSTADPDGLATFSAAAALTDMAAWMAHDADQNLLAWQHFQRALALASVGVDRQLRAHILGGMSHLAHHLSQPEQAMQLARVGMGRLEEGPANPELAARLLAMEARGHAALGEPAASARLLLRAEQTLDRAPAGEQSEWISRFDEASLAGEAARCLRRLGQLGDARRQAERVIALRPGDRARSRAFGQLILAQVLIQQRKLDEACAVGRQILDGTAALSSFLVLRQLQRLRELLAADQSAPAVAEFLGYLDVDLRRRMNVYRALSADYAG